MHKEKNMLLPVSFFAKVWLLIDALKDYDLEPCIVEHCDALEHLVHTKIDAINKRGAFSKYKSAAPGSDERNALRLAYLDLAGIHKDWISSDEISL